MTSILETKGCTFGIYHSFIEWGLVLEDYEISYPEQKKEFIEVPGKFDKYIDATYAMVDYPIFERRTGKFKLRLLNELIDHTSFSSWQSLVDDMAKKIHGKKLRIILDEDKQWYYDGYVAISSATLRSTTIGTVEIEANLYPYRRSINKSIVRMTKTVDGEYKITNQYFGRMPTKVSVEIFGTVTDDVIFHVEDAETKKFETYSFRDYQSFNVWGSRYNIYISQKAQNDDFDVLLTYDRGEL